MERVSNTYLKSLKESGSSESYHDLIFEFYVTFSRFEYTLKKLKYLKETRNHEARPDWGKYVEENKETFDLEIEKIGDDSPTKKAMSFLFSNPPKKQYKDENNDLIFRSTPDGSRSDTKRLCTYVNRIRNNLFHGGKALEIFNHNPRNEQLIKAALLVMCFWIERNERFKNIYFNS